MASAHPTVAPNATAALHAALQTRGFALDDFRFGVASATADAQSLGMPGGLITIRCRSTGEERVYPFGSGSAWLGAFVMELGAGHFCRAARMPRVPVPGIARPSVLQRLRAIGRDWSRAFDAGRALGLTPPPLTSPP